MPLAIILLVRNIYFASPQLFHTYSPAHSSWESMFKVQIREMNYIDCYGEVWLFDGRVNQIAIMQVGNDFLRSNKYIESEKKYEIVFPDGSSEFHYTGIRHHNTTCSVDDLDGFYKKYGYDIHIKSTSSGAVLFDGTPEITVIKSTPNMVVLYNKEGVFEYAISPGTARRFTHASMNVFDYEQSIRIINENLVDEGNAVRFTSIMEKWKRDNDCRDVDVPVYKTVNYSDFH